MTTTLQQRRDALDLAIKRAGGIQAFANALGCSHQAVYQWKDKGHVPFVRATRIEVLYGVPREDLIRPDEAEAYLTPSGSGDVL